MAKRGQPTKKVPRVEARLEEALSKGLPRWAACAYAKISRSAFNEWLHDPAFNQKVLEWETVAMTSLIEGVAKVPAGKMFLLSRRFRADYGDKVEIAHSGGVQVSYVNDWRGSTPDAPLGTETRTE